MGLRKRFVRILRSEFLPDAHIFPGSIDYEKLSQVLVDVICAEMGHRWGVEYMGLISDAHPKAGARKVGPCHVCGKEMSDGTT